MPEIVIAVAMIAALPAFGQVTYVDRDASGANDGMSWDDAYVELCDAVLAVSSGEIWVAEGVYRPTDTADRAVSFVMVDGVSLYGGFGGVGVYESSRAERDPKTRVTTLSGDIGVAGDSSDNSYHVVVGASSATLDGFTIADGRASEDIMSPDKSSAGMDNDNVTGLVISGCRFVRNVANYDGGAIGNSDSTVIVLDCIFESNSLAIYNWYGELTVENGVFSANTAGPYGNGGVYLRSTIGSVSNCVFVGNAGGGDGGSAAGGWNCVADITNCTICGCLGDALEFSGSSVDAQISNCIFWNNETADIAVKNGATCTVSHSMIAQATGFVDGGGNIACDPLFANSYDADGADDTWFTADDGLALGPGSVCIDAADGDAAPTADILGNPRHDDPGLSNIGSGAIPHVDMGAYEFQGDSPETVRPVATGDTGCGPIGAGPLLLPLLFLAVAMAVGRGRSSRAGRRSEGAI